MNENISERIRKIRAVTGLTQAQLAEKTGINKSSLSVLENEGRSISQKSLNKIIQAFGLNPDWMLYGEGEMYLQVEKQSRITTNANIQSKTDTSSIWDAMIEDLRKDRDYWRDMALSLGKQSGNTKISAGLLATGVAPGVKRIYA